MRLIFVSRARYEALKLTAATIDEQRLNVIEDLRSDRDHLRTQNADLLATVLALKTQGATVPAPSLAKREPDGLSQVIASVAGSNSALRRQLGAYAREQMALDASVGEIIEKLRHWDDASDGVDD